MPFAKKIVLHIPSGYVPDVDVLIAKFIQDGVKFVAVVGPDCAKVEDMIDDAAVGDGINSRFILTSSHPGETLDEVVEFARCLTGEYAGDVEIIELG